jgi:uncharacterized membrane protein YeiH
MSIMYILSLISSCVFAAEGAIIYMEFGNNFLLALFFGTISAILGGTVRDLILKRKISWLNDHFILLLIFPSIFITYYVLKK